MPSIRLPFTRKKQLAPGGAEIDLSAGVDNPSVEPDNGHAKTPLLERIMMQYVNWKSRRQ